MKTEPHAPPPPTIQGIFAMELLTRPEAAKYLRLSIRKLDALASKGAIRCSKFGEGKRARVVYNKEDLDSFVLENMTDTAERPEDDEDDEPYF